MAELPSCWMDQRGRWCQRPWHMTLCANEIRVIPDPGSRCIERVRSIARFLDSSVIDVTGFFLRGRANDVAIIRFLFDGIGRSDILRTRNSLEDPLSKQPSLDDEYGYCARVWSHPRRKLLEVVRSSSSDRVFSYRRVVRKFERNPLKLSRAFVDVANNGRSSIPPALAILILSFLSVKRKNIVVSTYFETIPLPRYLIVATLP